MLTRLAACRWDDLLRWLGSRSSSGRAWVGPRTLAINVTTGCPMGCLLCPYHSELAIGAASPPLPREIEPSFFAALLAEARKLRVREIFLSGEGEPLVHPGIYGMLVLVRSAGFRATLVTSGWGLESGRLPAWPGLSIRASLHGLQPSSWRALHPRALVSGLDEILGRLSEAASRGARVEAYHVLCRENYREAGEAVLLGRRLGFARTHLRPFLPFPGSAALEIPLEHCAELAGLLEEARKRGRETAHPVSIEGFPPAVASSPAIAPAPPPCEVGWLYSEVDVGGEVYFCCRSRQPLGAPGEKSWRTAWRSPRYRSWRKLGLARGREGRDPECPPCRLCHDRQWRVKSFIRPFGA